ncbi:hypothetical protein BJV82DRAFT_606003 [Fennellomyces sp. T-0311]|nr:hypothetical protein BJV82DRAFT_606003 [Fennellomyces sp. T-0311]
MDDSNESYTSTHRLFMQVMLSRRVMDIDTAQALYHRLPNAEQEDFQEFVANVNQAIDEIDLALRQATDERTGNAMLLLVNTSPDVSSQLATLYTRDELTYFKHILNAMIAEPEVTLSNSAALEVGAQLKMKLNKAQNVLDRLVEDRWLDETDGFYTLSLRSAVELRSFFEESHPDLARFCRKCAELVTKGQQCRQCDTRIHHHCSTAETCSLCSQPLDDIGFASCQSSSSSSLAYYSL